MVNVINDYDVEDIWNLFGGNTNKYLTFIYKLRLLWTFREKEMEHDHDKFTGVHDSSQHDTHEFNYNSTRAIDERIIFLIMPIFLLLAIFWLAFDWVGCISSYYTFYCFRLRSRLCLRKPTERVGSKDWNVVIKPNLRTISPVGVVTKFPYPASYPSTSSIEFYPSLLSSKHVSNIPDFLREESYNTHRLHQCAVTISTVWKFIMPSTRFQDFLDANRHYSNKMSTREYGNILGSKHACIKKLCICLTMQECVKLRSFK